MLKVCFLSLFLFLFLAKSDGALVQLTDFNDEELNLGDSVFSAGDKYVVVHATKENTFVNNYTIYVGDATGAIKPVAIEKNFVAQVGWSDNLIFNVVYDFGSTFYDVGLFSLNVKTLKTTCLVNYTIINNNNGINDVPPICLVGDLLVYTRANSSYTSYILAYNLSSTASPDNKGTILFPGAEFTFLDCQNILNSTLVWDFDYTWLIQETGEYQQVMGTESTAFWGIFTDGSTTFNMDSQFNVYRLDKNGTTEKLPGNFMETLPITMIPPMGTVGGNFLFFNYTDPSTLSLFSINPINELILLYTWNTTSIRFQDPPSTFSTDGHFFYFSLRLWINSQDALAYVWRTDGTLDGTIQLAALEEGFFMVSSISPPLGCGNMFFQASGDPSITNNTMQLWVTDGYKAEMVMATEGISKLSMVGSTTIILAQKINTSNAQVYAWENSGCQPYGTLVSSDKKMHII